MKDRACSLNVCAMLLLLLPTTAMRKSRVYLRIELGVASADVSACVSWNDGVIVAVSRPSKRGYFDRVQPFERGPLKQTQESIFSISKTYREGI